MKASSLSQLWNLADWGDCLGDQSVWFVRAIVASKYLEEREWVKNMEGALLGGDGRKN